MTSGTSKPPPRQRRGLALDARQRHWLRALILLVVTFVAALYGSVHRPSVQQAPDVVGPSIVVLADRQGVAATVNTQLSVRHNGRSSELTVTITPTSSNGAGAALTVVLRDFPAGSKGTAGTQPKLPEVSAPAQSSPAVSSPEAALPTPRGYKDYALTEQFGAAGTVSSGAVTITITAPRPVGEATRGYQLRVDIPDLVGAASAASVNTAYPIQDLVSGLSSAQSRADGYPVALQAGQSSFSDAFVHLSDYQILAGDSPTPLGRQWTWTGINAAAALAADVGGQQEQQKSVFYSGIALGVAASAAIGLILELIPSQPAGESPGPGSEDEPAPSSEGEAEAERKQTP
jgi:hypothetical protein